MARVLIVSALQVFPPLSGGNRRTALIAEGMAALGHEVRVFSLIGRKRDMLRGAGPSVSTIRPGVEEYVARPRWTWLKAMWAYRRDMPPMWALEAFSRPEARLTEDQRWAEVMVLDFPFVMSAARGFRGVTVLNTHNVEARLFKDTRVAPLEIEAVGACQIVCGSSTEEIAHFRGADPTKPMVHVPNAVGTARFDKAKSRRAETRSALGLSEAARVLLFPASAYGPNREGYEFLRDFSMARSDVLERENLYFLVTGSVSKVPMRQGRLIVTGPVPEIEPYFAAADWGVNPIFSGSGTSIKLAEMIAARLPVLTTAVGARGFDLASGGAAVFFEREELENRLANLTRDEGTIRGMTDAAWTAAARYLDTKEAVRPLDEAVRACLLSTREYR